MKLQRYGPPLFHDHCYQFGDGHAPKLIVRRDTGRCWILTWGACAYLWREVTRPYAAELLRFARKAATA